LFLRDNVTGWALQQVLTANDGGSRRSIRPSVSISGDNVAVGAAGRTSAPGGLHLHRSGTRWTQGVTLTATGGLQGTTRLCVSIPGPDLGGWSAGSQTSCQTAVGSAYVFTSLDGGVNWAQQFSYSVITGQAKAGDHLGWSVAAVGIPADARRMILATKPMLARFTFSCAMVSVWTQQTRINRRHGWYRVGASVGCSAYAVLGATAQLCKARPDQRGGRPLACP